MRFPQLYLGVKRPYGSTKNVGQVMVPQLGYGRILGQQAAIFLPHPGMPPLRQLGVSTQSLNV